MSGVRLTTLIKGIHEINLYLIIMMYTTVCKLRERCLQKSNVLILYSSTLNVSCNNDILLLVRHRKVRLIKKTDYNLVIIRLYDSIHTNIT